ncbi:hypothetical protein [Opitutus sp. GAS368]|uniref:hypothetical protein n=1 Tax=Opitutus sp. GAS368 TaxID=1882749 RepID=UPI00087D6E6B|nr:hypothetical protein [Opitutus sp. GAS368]SDS00302.1 hypothetical protein SAMN05444173_1591 [Opitutus sp. GAS368]
MNSTLPTNVKSHLIALKLSKEAIDYIEKSEIAPSMAPNGCRSYTVRYPCRLTGKTLVLHSHQMEFAGLLTILGLGGVLYVLEQPEALDLGLPRAQERFYRPDFLVIWNDNRPPTIFETKPSAMTSARAVDFPEKCASAGKQAYRMPLAEAAAAKLRFTFRAITEHNFEPHFVQNMLFLEPYRRWKLENPLTQAELTSITKQIAGIDDAPGAFERLRDAKTMKILISPNGL